MRNTVDGEQIIRLCTMSAESKCMDEIIALYVQH